MIYTILSVENKGQDWKVATVKEAVEGGSTHENVSINRKNKEGAVAFANFDLMQPLYSFEGSDIWENAQGRKYIFAPKPKEQPKKAWQGSGAPKAAAVAAAQEKKAEHIREAQETKAHSIKVAAAMRDATLLAVAALEGSSFELVEERQDALRRAFLHFREFYLAEWENTEKLTDVPFGVGAK